VRCNTAKTTEPDTKLDGWLHQSDRVNEIEFETSQLAEQLPADIDVTILSQLDELKVIELTEGRTRIDAVDNSVVSEVESNTKKWGQAG